MGWLVVVSLLLSLGIALLHAQSSGTAAPQQGASGAGSPSSSTPQQDNSIPDAPSTVQPSKPLPQNPPPNSNPEPAAPPQSVAPEAPAKENPADNSAPAPPQGTKPNNQVPINIRPVPEGGATSTPGEDQVETYTLPRVTVNQVLLPVTVTDEAGHLVPGLTYKDFTVLENGKKQKLNFFSSSTFAVSAAVLIDLGMKDVDLQKVNHTYAALQGAFSEFDELSVYTYGNVVGQLTGWGAVGPALSARLNELSNVRGQNNGPPVTSGPIASGVPMINNIPVDPATPRPVAATQPARVMNDAILKAAIELSRREKTRRKIIFVISDGHEYRSDASYRDVLRVLLSNNIIVYAVGLRMPETSSFAKLHIPRFGFTDILPRYVNATGGQVWNELTRNGIEDAYGEALGYARNQYTMGYVMPKTPAGEYRSVEVRVERPSCRSSIRPCVNVYTRDGYYPIVTR